MNVPEKNRNPGAGKSAILNALGGDFFSGFRAITGNPGSSTKIVKLRDKTVALIDTPGVHDPGKEGTISGNLKLLQDELNGCGDALLFFVIKPNSGRISAGDFAVLELLLKNLERTPRIGLFVTRVASDEMLEYDSTYRNDVIGILKEKDVNTTHLEANDWCVLQSHSKADGFSDEEKVKICDYVLSFAPAEVKVDKLCESFFQRILAFFRKLFS
ncbi:hypothetical protein EC991_001770 [Linnemannia zychae]|nr:hypothetical protein EC991_001770 [Linnemannia zychae]